MTLLVHVSQKNVAHVIFIFHSYLKGRNAEDIIDNKQFKQDSAAASGPPEEELLMWKPTSIENHNLEILRSQLNEKYTEANLKNYYDLHR